MNLRVQLHADPHPRRFQAPSRRRLCLPLTLAVCAPCSYSTACSARSVSVHPISRHAHSLSLARVSGSTAPPCTNLRATPTILPPPRMGPAWHADVQHHHRDPRYAAVHTLCCRVIIHAPRATTFFSLAIALDARAKARGAPGSDLRGRSPSKWRCAQRRCARSQARDPA